MPGYEFRCESLQLRQLEELRHDVFIFVEAACNGVDIANCTTGKVLWESITAAYIAAIQVFTLCVRSIRIIS